MSFKGEGVERFDSKCKWQLVRNGQVVSKAIKREALEPSRKEFGGEILPIIRKRRSKSTG